MCHKRFSIIIANLLVMVMLLSQTIPGFAKSLEQEITDPPAPPAEPKTDSINVEPDDETTSDKAVTKQNLFLPYISSLEGNQPSVEAADDTPYWREIVREGFEGAWPTGYWSTSDCDNDPSDEQYWDDESYETYSGSWSAWPVGGGYNELNPLYSNYPDNACAWMLYVVDLTYAREASLSFKYWMNTEINYDYLGAYVWCLNTGAIPRGVKISGNSNDWQAATLDLFPCLGNSIVFVGIQFTSDYSNTGKGPFIDDVVIQEYR